MNLRFQFGVRSLLLATAVIGAFLSGLELGRRTAVKERDSWQLHAHFMMEHSHGVIEDNAILIKALEENGIKVPELHLDNTVEFAGQLKALEKKQAAMRRASAN